MIRQQTQTWWCAFCSNDMKNVPAVRLICWDSNSYENDKYAWACAKHAEKYAVKENR